MSTPSSHLRRLLSSVIDPRAYLHLLRLVNYYNYSHVQPRRQLRLGEQVLIAPNVSFRGARNISLGDRTHVGERCVIWAGTNEGAIDIGADCLLAPEVTIVTSKYRFAPGVITRDAGSLENPVVIGDNVWLGARCIVTAGVSIGDGAVIGAGAVVTHDIPAGAVAVGVPARVVETHSSAATR